MPATKVKAKPKSHWRVSVGLALAIFLVYIVVVQLVLKPASGPDAQAGVAQILNQMILKPQNTRVLLLFYNNSEQRFGGGFSGSAAVLSKQNGKIKVEPVKNIYYYDDLGKARFDKEKSQGIAPAVDSPYIRDSNTMLQWREDAKIAADRFAYATNQPIDGVIGLTPDVLKGLLQELGPVRLDQYNQTFTADNFLEKVELEVESGQDKQNNQDPKSILGELGAALVSKLWALNIYNISKLYPILQSAAERKAVVFWSRQDQTQQAIDTAKLGGNLAMPSYDYSLLAEQNYSANKSTAYIRQTVKKDINIATDGTAVVNETIKRAHTSDYKYQYYDPWGKFTAWLVGENNSVVELAVPPGSEVSEQTKQLPEFSQHTEGGVQVISFRSDLMPLTQAEYKVSYTLPWKYQMGDSLDVVSLVQKQVGGFAYNFQLTLKVPDNYHLSATNLNNLIYSKDADSLVTVYNTSIDQDTLMVLRYAKN